MLEPHEGYKFPIVRRLASVSTINVILFDKYIKQPALIGT